MRLIKILKNISYMVSNEKEIYFIGKYNDDTGKNALMDRNMNTIREGELYLESQLLSLYVSDNNPDNEYLCSIYTLENGRMSLLFEDVSRLDVIRQGDYIVSFDSEDENSIVRRIRDGVIVFEKKLYSYVMSLIQQELLIEKEHNNYTDCIRASMETGEEMWRYTVPDKFHITSYKYHEGNLFLITYDMSPKDPNSSKIYPSYLICLDPETGQEKWKLLDYWTNNFHFFGNKAYEVVYEHVAAEGSNFAHPINIFLRFIDLDTLEVGKRLISTEEHHFIFDRQLLYKDKLIFASKDDGYIWVADLSKEELRSSISVGVEGMLFLRPLCVHKGILYLKDINDTVYVIDSEGLLD